MNQKASLYIVVSSAVMILFCLVYIGTYSYFVAGITDNRTSDDHSMTAAEIQNVSIANVSTVTSSLLIPGESTESTFQVENPSNVPMCFELVWNDVTNTFVNQKDLIVALEEDQTPLTLDSNVFPTANGTLKSKLSIPANSTKNYKLTVTYQLTEDDQLEDRGKTFSATVKGKLINCD